MRDRFVMGMLPGCERDKLFAQDLAELKLAKAIELAATLRSAPTEAAIPTAHLALQPDQQLFKVKQRAEGRSVSEKCTACGHSNHVSSMYRFAKYRRIKCNMQGNIKKKMYKKVNYVVTDDAYEGDDG